MNYKKIFVGMSLVAMLAFASVPVAQAVTVEELQAQMQSLLALVAELQKQLAEKLQSNGSYSAGTQASSNACVNLYADLWIGKRDVDTNGEISKLQRFLLEQNAHGLDFSHSGMAQEEIEQIYITGYYGQKTAEAVVRWQKAHGMDFVTLKSGVGPMTRAKMKCQLAEAMQAYEAREFTFQYPKEAFVVVQSDSFKLPNGSTQYSGTKLITQVSFSRLGKSECSYGESGLTVQCSVESEPGIEFFIVNQPAPNLVGLLYSSIEYTVPFAGKHVVRYSMGAEGDGADYYFVPLGEEKTLMVVRLYRQTTNGAFPSDMLFREVADTLQVR